MKGNCICPCLPRPVCCLPLVTWDYLLIRSCCMPVCCEPACCEPEPLPPPNMPKRYYLFFFRDKRFASIPFVPQL